MDSSARHLVLAQGLELQGRIITWFNLPADRIGIVDGEDWSLDEACSSLPRWIDVHARIDLANIMHETIARWPKSDGIPPYGLHAMLRFLTPGKDHSRDLRLNNMRCRVLRDWLAWLRMAFPDEEWRDLDAAEAYWEGGLHFCHWGRSASLGSASRQEPAGLPLHAGSRRSRPVGDADGPDQACRLTAVRFSL